MATHTIYSSEDGKYKVCEDWVGNINRNIKIGIPNRSERIYELELSEDNQKYENSKVGIEFYISNKTIVDFDEDLEIQLELIRESRYGVCRKFHLN